MAASTHWNIAWQEKLTPDANMAMRMTSPVHRTSERSQIGRLCSVQFSWHYSLEKVNPREESFLGFELRAG